jgi:hypothetical protein
MKTFGLIVFLGLSAFGDSVPRPYTWLDAENFQLCARCTKDGNSVLIIGVEQDGITPVVCIPCHRLRRYTGEFLGSYALSINMCFDPHVTNHLWSIDRINCNDSKSFIWLPLSFPSPRGIKINEIWFYILEFVKFAPIDLFSLGNYSVVPKLKPSPTADEIAFVLEDQWYTLDHRRYLLSRSFKGNTTYFSRS